ncbi:MAG: lysozyme inhibitor LprI family protein [Cyanobacteria bacterium P01_C01_bin.118]
MPITLITPEQSLDFPGLYCLVRYTPMVRARYRKTMGKSPYKISSIALVLFLLLGSCGRSQQVSDPEESTAEPVTAAPSDPPAEQQPSPETVTTPASQAAESNPAVTESPPRPNPIALAKQDCGQMATQTDINQCAAENYSISDKALNQVYRGVLQDLGDSAKAKLTTAEERWIVFRDAQCTFESDRFEDGSMAPLIQASCMEQITDNRIAELQQADQTQLSYADVDAQLNQIYQAIQALVGDAQSEALTDVQLNWLDYRDAHCEYEASLPAASDQNACLATITETRVWQLQALQDELSL